MGQPFDSYTGLPSDMKRYLGHYGWHFNRKACDFAVSLMRRKEPETGKSVPVEPLPKERVDALCAQFGVRLEPKNAYDAVYLANMVKADFWKSSIEDERHLALYVGDVLNDPDAADGLVMRKWLVSMVAAGEPVYWEDFL